MQADVVQHARAEPEREVAHQVHHLIDELTALGHGRREPRITGHAKAVDASQLHAQRRQHLTHVIVQFAGELAALFFLRRHQLL